MSFEVKVDIKNSAVKGISEAIERATALTMEELRTEVIKAQVIPFDVGGLQNNHTFITATIRVGDEVVVFLRSDAPQARRLYYHPEYNFQTVKNANARGKWYEDWLPGGSKETFAPNTFGLILRRELK